MFKLYYQIVGTILGAVLVYGFMIPFFLSAKDNFAVFLGIGFLLASLPAFGFACYANYIEVMKQIETYKRKQDE